MGVKGRARTGMRPKDLGTLDESRGGLILPRRLKAAPEPNVLKDGLDYDLLGPSQDQGRPVLFTTVVLVCSGRLWMTDDSKPVCATR
jgi:hypothetical protein